ncbi:MAG: hypothetical protein R3A46_16560 [Thermomicrobiales bacterium]
MIVDDRIPDRTGAPPRVPGKGLMFWYSVAAGPLIWAIHVSVSYMMVGLVCDWGTGLPIYLATLVALAAVGIAGYYAYGTWRQLQQVDPDERSRIWGRENLLMTSALVMAALFSLIIIGSAVQVVFWSACTH